MKNEVTAASADSSARFMGIGTALLFSCIFALNALAF
jgi:hypothetical protein